MKYVKKPVVIEAIQFDGTIKSRDDILSKLGNIFTGPYSSQDKCYYLTIPTLEGVMIAYPGAWIVKGIKGELYPVADDVFKETYQELLPDNPIKDF